jgi:hypothetical protein
MDPRERLIEAKIIRYVSDRSGAAINSAAVGSSPGLLDPGADIRAAVERVTIRRTTLDIQLAEGMAEDSPDRILVIPGRRHRPIDAARSFREKADDPLPCGRCELRRARFSSTRFTTLIAGKTN